MRQIILIGLLLFILLGINAQNNKIDSLENAISDSNTEELLRVYLQLSDEYINTDLSKAEYYSKKLISLGEGNHEILGLTYFRLATIFGMKHEKDTVLDFINKALTHFDAINDSTLDASIPARIIVSLENFDNEFRIHNLNALARRYFYNKPYLSKAICLKSVELAVKENKPNLIAETYKTLGFINKTLGNFATALDYDKRANVIYRQLSDSLNIGFTLNLMAVVHSLKGELDKSMSKFMDAEKYILPLHQKDPENKKYITYLSVLYTNIGLLYSFNLKEYEKAEEYFHRVIEYAKMTSDTIRLNASLTNLGHIYLTRMEYDKALSYFKQALDMATHTENFHFAARITHNIGNLYDQKKEYEKSREYYLMALDMMKMLNDQFGIAKTNQLIGETYLKENQVKGALSRFYTALKFAVKTDSKEEIRYIYFDLSKAYKSNDNIDSAYHYFKLYSDIDNELNNEESRKRVEELQVKYETEKKEAENKYLKERARDQEKVKYLLYFIVAALLILAVLLYYFFRMKSKLLIHEQKLKEVLVNKQDIEKKRLEESVFAEKQINRLQQEKLTHKNRELSTATLQILNKNNILSNIRTMLNNSDGKEFEIKDEVCKIVKENIDSDKDWLQFKLHFEEVHIGFFDKLTSDFPNLTSNELKLCAYLRINLSSKEIAQMLHNTPDTINKSRYRLRKKLNLSNEEDLVEFIRNV